MRCVHSVVNRAAASISTGTEDGDGFKNTRDSTAKKKKNNSYVSQPFGCHSTSSAGPEPLPPGETECKTLMTRGNGQGLTRSDDPSRGALGIIIGLFLNKTKHKYGCERATPSVKVQHLTDEGVTRLENNKLDPESCGAHLGPGMGSESGGGRFRRFRLLQKAPNEPEILSVQEVHISEERHIRSPNLVQNVERHVYLSNRPAHPSR